jgi:hypothetical protein
MGSGKTYLPDTNVLVDFGREQAVKARLEKAEKGGAKFVIAPPTMNELTVGVVRGGAKYFECNKRIFSWLKGKTILDMPRPFMGKVVGVPSKFGNVEEHHHVERIDLVSNSASYDDFLKRKDQAGSSWTDIDKSYEIHNAVLDKEFDALKKIAAKPAGAIDLAAKFAETFGPHGQHPDPAVFRQHFSAAVEYGEVTVVRIRGGANPRKNDPGRYGDFQLFFYLADPDIYLLTREDFSSDIKSSPQRTRIVGLDSLG